MLLCKKTKQKKIISGHETLKLKIKTIIRNIYFFKKKIIKKLRTFLLAKRDKGTYTY